MKRLATIIALLAVAAPATAAVRDQRIIRGGVTPIETFPYTVSLGMSGRPALDGHFCGGSVIAPDVVMTAAHCVIDTRARQVVVTAGRARLSDEGTGQRVRVTTIKSHPGWHGGNHDIALLRLAEPLSAPPVVLSRGGSFASALVAGWGLTRGNRSGTIPDDLRAVEMPVATGRSCRRIFGRGFDPGLMVCAGGDGRDSCNGDSGGPLVATTPTGAIEQIGIVSYGGPICGKRGMPGAYTRVSAERGWIARTLGIPTPTPVPTATPTPPVPAQA